MNDKKFHVLCLKQIFKEQIDLLSSFGNAKEGTFEFDNLLTKFNELWKKEMILKEKLKLINTRSSLF